MRTIFLFITATFCFSMAATATPPDQVYQIGTTRVEVRYWSGTRKPVFVDLMEGKRTYQLSMNGREVRGDLVLPKRRDPLYGRLTGSGSLLLKSNASTTPVGLKADAIKLVPNEGLVGYTLTHTIQDSLRGDTQYGFIRWRLDLATGEVSEVLTDEVVVVAPREFVLAESFLYVRQGPIKGQAGEADQVYGYLFENDRLSRQWEHLAVMSIPRGTTSGWEYQEVKRYVRHQGAYMQIAAQRDGATCEVLVFDRMLKDPRTYFPALLVYQNHERMPDWNFRPGRDLIADYREGKGFTPDKLFQRMVLVPSPDIAGLYGVLQPDGSVLYPEGSLGLAPMLTREQVAGAPRDSTYLLVHYFVVAYPGEGDQMSFAVAGPDGKLSYGSAESPVWSEWLIYQSEAVAENNSFSHVHDDLLVGKLPDGHWQCYLASRYLTGWQNYEMLNYYRPTPVGEVNEDPALAISSAEVYLLRIDSLMGKRQEEVAARFQADFRRRQAEQAARRNAEHEEWLRNRPSPPVGGGGRFTSQWQGFTYTSQTTARYNQAAQQSSFNNRMREYNSYLNARIYRRW
jgi:hypothetical protein